MSEATTSTKNLACKVRHLGDKCGNDLGLVSLEGLCHRSPSEGHFGGAQGSKRSCHGAIFPCETMVKKKKWQSRESAAAASGSPTQSRW